MKHQLTSTVTTQESAAPAHDHAIYVVFDIWPSLAKKMVETASV